MKLGESLAKERVLTGAKARDLGEAVATLLQAPGFVDGLEPAAAEELAVDLASGKAGVMVRVNEQTMLGAFDAPASGDLRAALGIFPDGFMAATPREGEPVSTSVLLLFATPGRVAALRAEAFPRIVRMMRFGGSGLRFLRAETADAVLEMNELMDVELQGELTVRDAMNPVSLRVYPDTPLNEIVDLMVRRSVRALPVIGSEYEVLGMITIGDALRQLVPKWMGGEEAQGSVTEESEPLARDLMSRSVMGVAEDQTLLDAARVMANKGLEHLPVVRDGELVGFVTEDTVLRMLSSR